ncbi:MAG: 30S ribosomal protein S9 [Candidatus Micrarchaeota archaeon]|nr:MAG: 30S ribosomal protein S9 [Candidatus Micrarchaeota archaeon]
MNEVTNTEEIKSEANKEPKKAQKKRSKKGKVIIVTAKRKTAIARAYAKEGTGIIKINKRSINVIKPDILKDFILEPVRLTDYTSELASKLDISINVKGGGFSAQAQAARAAIARVLVEYSDNKSLIELYKDYDRYLLINDYRRVEPKKYLGTKARARFQTSYR